MFGSRRHRPPSQVRREDRRYRCRRPGTDAIAPPGVVQRPSRRVGFVAYSRVLTSIPRKQPLTSATVDPSAATAAASAFTRQASPGLSSAAAAAALRSRPHTPTNVADVQTKRTMRRSASGSSVGSRNNARGLKRSPSAGSMSERSLRSMSPRRPTHKPADEPPPVPSVPDNVESIANGSAKATNGRKVAVARTQPLKLGSEAIKEGHGSWFGPATVDTSPRMRPSDTVPPKRDTRRTSSGSSINFSYPIGAQVTSPTPDDSRNIKAAPRNTPTRSLSKSSDHELVYDPNSRRMVPKSEIPGLEQGLKEPRRKSTRRKKKKQSSAASSESGAGTTTRSDEPIMRPGKSADFEVSGPTTRRTHDDTDAELFIHSKAQARDGHSPRPEVGETMTPSSQHTSASVSPLPSREPSVQRRYEAYRPPPAVGHGTAQRAEHLRDAAAGRASALSGSCSPVELPADNVRETSPVEQSASPSAEPDHSDNQDRKVASPTHNKTVSIDKGKTLALPVRHSPPPRSTSPIKSALKYPVGSSRAPSISDQGSEASCEVTNQHLDPGFGRKKSVRVSFHDESTIIGHAASEHGPESASPATKKRWYNLTSRRDGGSPSGDHDDGEIMKPRPMLPSFGSIREKKARENEERPLVRPQSFANSPSRPDLPTIPSDPNLGGQGGLSSDHAVGTALTRDIANKQEANDSNEPLPPQVTSVEGHGFLSDDSDDSSLLRSDDEEQQEHSAPSEPEPISPAPESETSRLGAKAGVTGDNLDQDAVDSVAKRGAGSESHSRFIPQIAISEPSPQPREDFDVPDSPCSSEDQFFDMPGTFPDSGPDKDVSATPSPPQPTEFGESQTTDLPPSEPVALKLNHPHEIPGTIEEESEDSAVFSDAYEDLSDLDEDGFQSLAAVVDSPGKSRTSQKASDKAVASIAKTIRESKGPANSASPSDPAQVAAGRTPDIDWEKAKAYWRSLSSEKRRQLEREAMREAGEEADLDEVKPVAKPRKKKSVKKDQNAAGISESPANASAKAANVGQAGRTMRKTADTEQAERSMRKTLRGARPTSSNGSATGPQSPEREGRMRSLRSPPPAPASEASSDGGMRRTLRTQPPSDTSTTEAPSPKEKRPLSLFSQKFKMGANKRPISQDSSVGPSQTDWTASLPQRRGSFSSETSFRRSTPRPQSSGFRKSMRSDAGSPGMVPGSGHNKMGSFSMSSQSPPRGAFRRRDSSFSNASASPGKIRSSLRSDSADGSPRHKRMLSFGMFSKKEDKPKARNLDDSSDEEAPAFAAAAHKTVANGSAPYAGVAAAEPAHEESESLSDSDSGPYQTPAAGPSKRPPQTPPSANGSLSHSRTGRGSPQKPERKGGIMSALRRKRADPGRISRPERTDSAARRDTKLERSNSELEAIRTQGEPGDEDRGEANGSPGKLRKRVGGGKESPPQEKKKKFSALRRVFKKHD